MSKLAEIRNYLENLGFAVYGVYWARDCSITISLIKTQKGNIGKTKTVYVPYSTDKEFAEIHHYVLEKLGVPTKK